jgi:hypothetical protein
LPQCGELRLVHLFQFNVAKRTAMHCLNHARSISDAGHITKLRIEPLHSHRAEMQREIHMRKITFFVAGVIVGVMISVGTWIGVGTMTTTSALASSTIDPFAMMMGAKDLPTSHYDDYSLVFN